MENNIIISDTINDYYSKNTNLTVSIVNLSYIQPLTLIDEVELEKHQKTDIFSVIPYCFYMKLLKLGIVAENFIISEIFYRKYDEEIKQYYEQIGKSDIILVFVPYFTENSEELLQYSWFNYNLYNYINMEKKYFGVFSMNLSDNEILELGTINTKAMKHELELIKRLSYSGGTMIPYGYQHFDVNQNVDIGTSVLYDYIIKFFYNIKSNVKDDNRVVVYFEKLFEEILKLKG
jgi:hypothetical protein